MLSDLGAEQPTAAKISAFSWLWELLFVLLLGPVLLFPQRFPLPIVVAALLCLLLPLGLNAVHTGRLLPATPINLLLVPLLFLFLPLSIWSSALFWQATWPKLTSLLWSVAIFYTAVAIIPPELSISERMRRLRIVVAIYLTVGVTLTAVAFLTLGLFDNPLLRPLSTLVINPNEIGGIVTLFVPLTLVGWLSAWLWPAQRSAGRFVLWSLLLLYFVTALLFTQSIGAMLGVIVGCGLALLVLGKRTRILFLLGTIVTLAFGALLWISPYFAQLSLNVHAKWNSSIITRSDIWHQALHATRDFPLFGTGLGTFRFVAPVLYPLSDSKADLGHAHNLFLQAALDFGWLGGLFFALIWIVLIITLARWLKRPLPTNTDQLARILGVGLLATLVAHGVYSLLDALAPGARPGFALWYLFGLIVALTTPAVANPRHLFRSPTRLAAAAVVTVVFTGMLWLFLPMQRASHTTAVALLSDVSDIETAVTQITPAADQHCGVNWHLGLLANKRGDVTAQNVAWQRLLTCSAQHIPLLRTVVPENHLLATEAVAQQPTAAEGHFWLAALEMDADPQAAVTLYESGLSINPKDAVRWVELGHAREQAGDIMGALAAFDQGCFLFDRGGNGCPHAGRLYLQTGQYVEAEERYRTALEQIPTFYAPTYWGLAETLMAQERTMDALPFLEQLVAHGDTQAAVRLADLEAKQK